MNNNYKNIFKVLYNSVLIQLIPLIILPLLTRAVSNEDLGKYMLWQGFASIIVILISAKLDLAIFTAKSIEESDNLFQIIFLLSILICPFVIVISLFLVNYFQILSKYSGIISFVIPLTIFSLSQSIVQASFSQMIFRSDFKSYNFWRLLQAVFISTSVVITVYFIKSGINSLVWFHSIANFVFLILLIYQQEKTKLLLSAFLKFRELLFVLKKFYRFPLYSLPADFLNSFSTQLPLILIGDKFGFTALAYFSMITRTLSAPISLIGNSILTIFKDDAGKEYLEEGNCKSSFLKTFKLLFFTSLVPFFILYLILPRLFSFFFGQSWIEAGKIAQIMVPLFLLRYISSPLSFTLYITQNQIFDLFWQILLIIVVYIIFQYSSKLFVPTISIYTVSYSLMYILYLSISYKASL